MEQLAESSDARFPLEVKVGTSLAELAASLSHPLSLLILAQASRQLKAFLHCLPSRQLGDLPSTAPEAITETAQRQLSRQPTPLWLFLSFRRMTKRGLL